MDVPNILVTQPTPLDIAKKRKHSDSRVCTEDARDNATSPMDMSNRRLARDGNENDYSIESQSEDDDGSVFETYLDDFDLEPYVPDDGDGLTTKEIKELHDELRTSGPHKFLEETIGQNQMNPRTLGIAFGLNPRMDLDDNTYLRLLGLVIVRSIYKRRKLPQYNTIDDAARLLMTSQNIVVITGAGISTSLGIPDFRSKGTGFYDKVRSYGYEEAEEVFEINNFDANPEIFFKLAGEILPDMRKCTPTHGFIRLLQDKNRLLTNYTQNIDNLETVAGLREDRFIQCHGSFATATCRVRECLNKVPGTDIFDDIRNGRVAKCKVCIERIAQQKRAIPPPQKRSRRNSFGSDDEHEDDDIPQPGVMKPDITFFGEQLPKNFFDQFSERDAKETDLVIVIGTSLKVAPVSEMPNYLRHEIPHIYISKEMIRHVDFDIQLLGNCDDVVVELCRRAGWDLEHELVKPGVEMVVQPETESAHIWMVKPATSAESDRSFGGGVGQQNLSDVGIASRNATGGDVSRRAQ